MIFLTIGTHEPFDRLVRAVDAWCLATGRQEEVFGQVTAPRPGGHVPQHFRWVSRLSPADYADQVARADLLVSHAGMGSILTALHLGKPIVIMPRRGHLRETRNDHQFTTVQRLGRRPGIHVAADETELPAVLDHAIAHLADPAGERIAPLADAAFTDALRAFLTGTRPKQD